MAGGTSIFVVDQTARSAPTERLAAGTGSSGSDGINQQRYGQRGWPGKRGDLGEYQVDGGAYTAAGTGTSFSLTSSSHTYSVRQTDVQAIWGWPAVPAPSCWTPAAPTENAGGGYRERRIRHHQQRHGERG